MDVKPIIAATRNMKTLKAWTYEAASRHGVSAKRIYEWQRRGYFGRAHFIHHNARVVEVIGEPRLLRLVVNGKPVRYDFTNVDWSEHDVVIAARLGCCRTLVIKRRKQRE